MGGCEKIKHARIHYTWYMSHIYIKESVYVFIDSKLNDVKGDLCIAHEHVYKTCRCYQLSNGIPDQFQFLLHTKIIYYLED